MDGQDNRISEIDRRIDDTDQMIKKYAEETLPVIYDDHQKMLAERIKAEAGRKNGDSVLANRHEILADVWNSLLYSKAITPHGR